MPYNVLYARLPTEEERLEQELLGQELDRCNDIDIYITFMFIYVGRGSVSTTGSGRGSGRCV